MTKYLPLDKKRKEKKVALYCSNSQMTKYSYGHQMFLERPLCTVAIHK